MRKYLAVALTALLVALAFFLPARISQWNDSQLLDEPHIVRDAEEREGFAERVQLSVAEKVLLLRSGSLTPLPLSGTGSKELRFALTEDSVVIYESEEPTVSDSSAGEEFAYETQEWSDRLASVQTEVRTLQTMGALPSLWSWDNTVESVSQSQILYIDSDAQMSFLVYCVELSCSPYSLGLTVDAQSGKILSFMLRWARSSAPDWGVRGADSFGSAWRDYWGMDAVDSTWNGTHIKGILEETEAMLLLNGSYTASAEINFTYDAQTVHIPLHGWAISDRGCSIQWNT